MKKTLIVILSFCAGLSSYSQTQDLLSSIATELKNNETYQAACEYRFSLPYGDTLTHEAFLTTQKVPTDNICGFHYNFQIAHTYGGEKFHDFAIYFDSIVYKSSLEKVKKISYHESPSQFIEIKLENGFIPSIQKRSIYFDLTPYEIGKNIENIIHDPDMIINQEPDTIIEYDTCLRYILESKSENNPFDRSNPEHLKEGKIIFEMCFHKSYHYPILYKSEVFTPMLDKLETAHFRNTIINQKLPKDYFSEETLLPVNWDKPEELTKIEKKSPEDLVGKQIPEWVLPVLGSEETYSSDNLKGKTTLLEFTATWCGHCYSAAKMMNRLEEKFENNTNIEIFSIFSSEMDKKEGIEKFAKRLDVKSPILYSASSVGKEYYVYGYPKFFIISPAGIVLKVIQGYGPTIEEEIIDELKELTR